MLAWTARNGLPFEFRVPANYDPERGANLVVVLHGNGLDQRWTFWNHPTDEFRVNDIVVSPDGTTASSATGASEFLDGSSDLTRMKELLEELKSHWKVRQTFLYGHSQGSFFVFHYAGHHPNTIDGVVGHASGMWAASPLSKAGHELAIGIMHGTDDHIPYSQAWYTRKAYREAKYPLVHLRTLFDWPHRPNWVQAQQMLAWCEGVTSTDSERVLQALITLSDPRAAMGLDPAALYAVAARLAKMEGASQAAQRRAAKGLSALEALSAQLFSSIERGLAGRKGPSVAEDEWLGIAIRVVEEWEGTPMLDSFLAGKGRKLVEVRKLADTTLSEYYRTVERDPAEAIEAGVRLLEDGWVSDRCLEISSALETLLAKSRELKLPKKLLDRASSARSAYAKGREKGFAAYTRALAKLELGR
ncbi:MAG: alpha/beta fold hydrolase [Planctomycetia bacterium]